MRGCAPIFAVSIRLSIASIDAAAKSCQQPLVRTRVGNLRETIRFTRRREQTSHRARYGSGGIAEMEHSKLANGNGAWSTDRTLCVLGSAGSNEHGEVGRQEGGPEEDSLEKN